MYIKLQVFKLLIGSIVLYGIKMLAQILIFEHITVVSTSMHHFYRPRHHLLWRGNSGSPWLQLLPLANGNICR